MKKFALIAAFLLSLTTQASALVCTLPFTLINGTLADANQVMANENTLAGCFNSVGGGGTVNPGATGQIAIYPAPGSNVVSGATMSGDCTITVTGLITCTKTNGVSFLPNGITNAYLAQMPALTHKCNPTNSTANAQDCSYPLLNVIDYGADPTGVADSTTFIQNAINALPVSGGIILFPVGNYKITAALVIGNGTSSAVSTRQGVIFRGLSMPVKSALTGFTTTGGPTLTWAGAANSQMLVIKGPLVGWGVENLVFECGSTSGLSALFIISAQHGDSKNLVFNKCNTSISSNTVNTFVGVNNTDSFHNNFTNILINLPDLTGTNGYVATGSGSVTPSSDTDFNTLVNITCLATTVSQAETCLYFQVSDSNWVYGVHVTGGFANLRAVSFDYTVSNNFPSGTKIFGLDPGGSTKVVVAGTPCASQGCGNNDIYGLSTSNTGNVQNLAGVNYIGMQTFLQNSTAWFANDSPPVNSFSIGDRLFIGDAATNYPNNNSCGTGDWFTNFEATTSNGACAYIGSFQMVVESKINNSNPMGGILSAGQSAHASSATNGTFGIATFALENKTGAGSRTGGSSWGIYSECDKTVDNGANCYGMEVDVMSAVNNTNNPDPFTQGPYIGHQIGCGSGVTTPTNFNCSAAIQVAKNSQPFRAGLVFLNGSLASGAGGGINAMSMPLGYFIVWYSAAGTAQGSLTVDGTNNLNINTGGTLKVNGTAGVTCAGSPSVSFATLDGIVTHC